MIVTLVFYEFGIGQIVQNKFIADMLDLDLPCAGTMIQSGDEASDRSAEEVHCDEGPYVLERDVIPTHVQNDVGKGVLESELKIVQDDVRIHQVRVLGRQVVEAEQLHFEPTRAILGKMGGYFYGSLVVVGPVGTYASEAVHNSHLIFHVLVHNTTQSQAAAELQTETLDRLHERLQINGVASDDAQIHPVVLETQKPVDKEFFNRADPTQKPRVSLHHVPRSPVAYDHAVNVCVFKAVAEHFPTALVEEHVVQPTSQDETCLHFLGESEAKSLFHVHIFDHHFKVVLVFQQSTLHLQ